MSLILSVISSAPVDDVSSVALSGGSGAMDVSFFGLFLQADFVVKFVMLSLIFASIWSWTIIFNKIILINAVKSQMNSFEKAFWSGQSLEALYERVKGRESHPLAYVFIAAMTEWQRKKSQDFSAYMELRAGLKERLYQAMNVASNKAMDKIDSNLSFLATLSSSGPFIGLFGTVWGIMVSFQSIAAAKNTTLAVVAPGIAEALLATAFGLAAAIPAAIFYNKFINEVDKINNKVENFSTELGAIMSRELDAGIMKK